jgi:DNA-binding XRE family transcriptional regulator
MIQTIHKNKVKYFREAIHLCMSELARRTGLTPQTIAKIEKGLPQGKIPN